MLLTSLMSQDMEAGLEGYGLTEARARVIWELSAGDGFTQRELAERLDVTPRNVTALVDALERTGFVSRTPHAADRRAIALVLTRKGRDTATKLQNEMTKFATDLFGTIPESELTILRRLLEETSARLMTLTQANEVSKTQ
jgi:DNA-binding MarR family transcriptional regulator